MKTNINKGQMDTNTQLLAEYITTEPEYIQDIINKAAKEAIEEYAESYCSKDVIINRCSMTKATPATKHTRILRCTGFKPSLTSGMARPIMTLIA